MVSSKNKRVALKRRLAFAAMISLVTVTIVSLAILLMHHVESAQLFDQWLTSLTVAWPIVFISILIIAPQLLRLSEWLVKDHEN